MERERKRAKGRELERLIGLGSDITRKKKESQKKR